MDELAIRVESIGKQYHIGGPQIRYRTLRETLVQSAKRPFLRISNSLRGNAYGASDLNKIIWALKNISFEVKPGEAIGIIGRNGAGKSTLLKVLTRITEPTEGAAEIRGRVGSLLEVGTGFHPELTGRENVYLNGAILGMKKVEIERKFDEIVDFAEIEKFLETPVKHYSSGMYVRLAFAVAAHLEPEILFVDEVLAVGDIAFQQKCLGKMDSIAKEGRTILFVSHNLAAVENLCRRGLVIDSGYLVCDDTQTNAIAHYLSRITPHNTILDTDQRSGSGLIRVTEIQFRDMQGNRLNILQSGQDVDVYLFYRTNPGYKDNWAHVGISVSNQAGVKIFSQSTRMAGTKFVKLGSTGAFVCRIPKIPLPPANYWLDFNVKVDEVYADSLTEAIKFSVVEGDFYKSGQLPNSQSGVSLVEGQWHVEDRNMQA